MSQSWLSGYKLREGERLERLHYSTLVMTWLKITRGVLCRSRSDEIVNGCWVDQTNSDPFKPELIG